MVSGLGRIPFAFEPHMHQEEACTVLRLLLASWIIVQRTPIYTSGTSALAHTTKHTNDDVSVYGEGYAKHR